MSLKATVMPEGSTLAEFRVIAPSILQYALSKCVVPLAQQRPHLQKNLLEVGAELRLDEASEHLAPLRYPQATSTALIYLECYTINGSDGVACRFSHIARPGRDFVEIAFWKSSKGEEMPDVVLQLLQEYVQWIRSKGWVIELTPEMQVTQIQRP